jgi:DNA invertase Pin-like site-specific DNA recombinase
MNTRSSLVSSSVAVGYIRGSTDEQKLTLAAQRDAITSFSAFNVLPVVAIFEDAGVSGSMAPHERPGLAAALRAVKDHRADFLVVAKRDRLSRDFTNTVLLEAQLKLLDPPCRIVTATEDADEEQTPEKRAMDRMSDVFAELELEKIRERTQKGVQEARKQGRLPGPKKWSTFTRGVLTVQLMQRLHTDGLSNTAIVAYCVRNDVFSPHRGRITMAHVRKCLASKEVAAPDLDQTASALCAAVKAASYYESRFRVGSDVERKRVRSFM